MPLWFWILISLGTGLLVGVEAWAWMRHSTSAIGLAVTGVISGVFGLALIAVGVLMFGGIAYGMFSGVTGSDPLGWSDSSGAAAQDSSGSGCDPNYEGACVPDSSGDVDCPEIDGTDISVVGDDVNGLDADGDGVACES